MDYADEAKLNKEVAFWTGFIFGGISASISFLVFALMVYEFYAPE